MIIPHHERSAVVPFQIETKISTIFPTRLRLLLLRRRLKLVHLDFQVLILLLELLDSHLEILHLLRGPNAHLFDDLHKAPQTEDDDKRRDFFDDSAGQDIDEEAGNNDDGIKNVKPRFEVSVGSTLAHRAKRGAVWWH